RGKSGSRRRFPPGASADPRSSPTRWRSSSPSAPATSTGRLSSSTAVSSARRSSKEASMSKTVTFHRWNDMPKERVTDNSDRRIVNGERMMLAHVYLAKGSVVPRHQHENEQLTYILEGALKFRIGNDGAEEIVVRSGEVLVIPSNVPHQAE